MKKLVFAAFLAVMVSCSGSGNKYLGNLLSLQAGDASDEAIAEEMSSLKGTVIPCVSGAPEIFSIVGDGAVFDGEKFAYLIEFTNATKVGSATVTLKFVNSETGKVYGEEVQILFLGSFYPETFCSGETILKYFFVNSIVCNDVDAFQKNVDKVIIDVDNPSDFKANKGKNPSMSVEDWALYFMESYYGAVNTGDLETYYAIDYEIGEFDGFTAAPQWQLFYKTEEIWKFLFPQKWQVIKEFRQKQIADGAVLVDIDVADPSFDEGEPDYHSGEEEFD